MSDELADQTVKQLRRLVRILAVILTIALLTASVGALVAWQTLQRVEDNADTITQNEREDILASRQALFRLCERQNLSRAGHHWAYQQGLASGQKLPAVIIAQLRQEPALAYFLGVSAKTSTANLKLTQRNLPILDCEPNLVGEPAMPLSAKAQERYVIRWSHGKLDPTPDPTRPLRERR